MMQSYASAASSGAAGPICTAARRPWVFRRITATSDVIGRRPYTGAAKLLLLLSDPFLFAVVMMPDAGQCRPTVRLL